MSPVFSFRVIATDGAARRGEMATAHGVVQTPAFMAVGTQGAVKGLTPRDLVAEGAEIVLANTYHLWLRPGDGVISRQGGLHRFIGWNRPILTDSGGFQAFSLGARRRIDEEGIHFRSHLDGSEHLLTPEGAAEIQARLGSDVAMALDECLAQPATYEQVRESTERTARWARRCRNRFLQLPENETEMRNWVRPNFSSQSQDRDWPLVTNPGQAQFGIIQGGTDLSLREMSVDRTLEVGFEAYALGGLSVGEPADCMYSVVEHTAPRLPADRARYLMGVGTPVDLVEAAARGIDLFDCVMPTRNARNGQLFTSIGRLNIKNARYAEDADPPDPACCCYTCSHFSRAYLRHLFLAGEMTGSVLNTVHNLRFYLDTMARIREAIVLRSLGSLRQSLRSTFTRQM